MNSPSQPRAIANTPGSADTTTAVETQGSFASPPSNTGAFLHKIPIDLPPGIGAMTPEVSIAYSSQGGVGIAGTGWDLPTAMITLNQAEGVRPLTVEADIMRYAPNTPVERYVSNFGTLSESREDGDYVTARKAYLLDPHIDARVEPTGDEGGSQEYLGEKAAWEIAVRDGTTYRYGYEDQASLWADETGVSKRKVAWMLDQVEDRHGNRMQYYYEQYPNGQDVYRQPVLRAIEYGIPASNQTASDKMLVMFEYIESPWKRFGYQLGTRTDFAYLLDEICVYAKASVVETETPGGHVNWELVGNGQPGFTDDWTQSSCWELTYDFEDDGDGDPATTYAPAYTSRPLLMMVQRRAYTGEKMPPWEFTYRHAGRSWQDVYAESYAAGGTPWEPPTDSYFEVATHDVSQQMIDVDGDGLADVITGRPDGTFDVATARPDPAGGLDYPATTWANPLSAAEPTDLDVTEIDANNDGAASNCWHEFEYQMEWESGSGLGFARPLTAAPEIFHFMYSPSVPLSDDTWNEQEPDHLDLGAFQFLHSSYYAPYPAFGKKNLVDRADTFDEIETYGSYKDTSEGEYGFDWRTTDCQDSGDRKDIDQCWNVATGGSQGMLGTDLQCLDHAGARWMAEAGVSDGNERGYSTELWTQTDLNGDGFSDWVYAAPVIVRDDAGAVRDFAGGANDWYWAPGNGNGWDSPRPWVVPANTGDILPTGVDKVHATSMLGVSVSDTDLRANRVWGVGVDLSVGVTGFGVGASLMYPGGSIGLPVAGVGFGSALGSGVGVGAIGGAFMGGMTQIATMGGNSRAVGAAAQSIRAVAGSGDLRAALPSIGVGFSLTNRGPILSFDLPLIGEVVVKFKDVPTVSSSMSYQGLIDLTGDGRADLVSAKYSALGGMNPKDWWLVYPNEGQQFGAPRALPFAATPEVVSPIGLPAIPIDALSKNVTSSQTDQVWVGIELLTIPIGVSEQMYGLADLNGDGLMDLVDASSQMRVNAATGTNEKGWTVYFNQGQIFSAGVWWPFRGEWIPALGDCTVAAGSPRLSRTVYGQFRNDTIGLDGNRVLVGSRQVQGMLDVNGDGRLDYWYEKPAPVEGDEDTCDYVTPSSNFSNLDEVSERTHPLGLHRKLLVRLGDGQGFGVAKTWIEESGLPLGGGIADYTNAGPADRDSTSVLAVGDFDGDGAPDLAKRFDLARWSEVEFGEMISVLFKLGEPGVDLLATATTPTGGTLEIGYRYDQPDPHQAGGQWVTETIRTLDLDPAHLDVTRRFYYEGGKYDRGNRTFQGFERVYQVSDESDGYTLSRYYQSPGLDGQLYCREVRRIESARDAVEALVAAHEAGWSAVTPGAVRANYVPPVAIGDADDALALVSTSPLLGDAIDPDGEGEGGDDSYGTPPAPSADDPAAEAEEEDRAENDEPYDAGEPAWPTDDSSAPADPLANPPVDSTKPGVTITWNNEDANDIPWWDIPVYDDDDDCTDGSTGLTTYLCDPQALTPSDLACGDADDPGELVKQEFSVFADYSGIVNVHTPRLAVGSEWLYSAAGTNPRVTASSFTYDDHGNVIETKDLGDVAVSGDELLTTTTYAPPEETVHVIDRPCKTVVRDGAGLLLSKTQLGYDGSMGYACTAVLVGDVSRIKRSVDTAGTFIETKATYTAEGLVATETDPRGMVTTHTYSAFFPWYETSTQQAIATLAGLQTLTSTHRYLGIDLSSLQQFGVIGEEEDANGRVTSITYDPFLRPLTVVRPLDSAALPTETFTYHAWDGDPADRASVTRSQRFAGGEIPTTTIYDGFGLEQRVETAPPHNLKGCVAGSCTVVLSEKTYDGDGRVIELVEPYFSNHPAAALRTASTYDLLGRVTGVIGPNAATTTTRYDRDLVTVADPDGGVSATQLDARGRSVAESRYAAGGMTKYSTIEHTYSADGNLLSTRDNADNIWTFAYDKLGRQTQVIDPNTGTKTTVYDDKGNPILISDARYTSPLRMATALVYDKLDRPLLRETRINTTISGKVLTGGTTLERTIYTYDVDPAIFPGAALACPDDHLGRLTRVGQWRLVGATLTQVSLKEYCYDERGRVSELVHTIDGVPYAYEHEYDSADAVIATTFPDGDTVSYHHDASGRLSSSANGAGDLLKASYVDASGLPTKRVFGTGEVKQRFCYEAGPAGEVGARMVVGDETMDFGCTADPIGTPVAGAIYDVSYTRSTGGRVLARHESFVRPGTGLEEHDTTYGYDEVHRLTAETYDGALTSYGSDELDNLTTLAGSAQSYGTTSRAIRNAGPNAILSGTGGRTFGYDVVGNAVTMTSGGSTWAFIRGFDGQANVVWQGAALAATHHYDEAGARVSRNVGGVVTRYAGAFRDGVDDETRYPGVGVKVGATQYFTFGDPAGSTALVVEADGDVVQWSTYEPFGGLRENATFDPDPADGLIPYDSKDLFNGKERDEHFAADDDIYDFGPRSYFADVGAWLTPDTSFDDGVNRYAFVKGDPINHADPDGHASVGIQAALDGQDAHAAIQQQYRIYNRNAVFDSPFVSIMADHGLLPMPAHVAANAWKRPDIWDSSTGFVYEIKPAKTHKIIEGVLQAGGYVGILKQGGFSNAHLGPMYAPNTYGVARGKWNGYFAYLTPVPGVIVYQKIPKTEYASLVLALGRNPSPSTVIDWMSHNPQSKLTQVAVGVTAAAAGAGAAGLTALGAGCFLGEPGPVCEAAVIGGGLTLAGGALAAEE